ncbi:hypothetical protein D9M73_250410 [compost metagenome]
MPRGKVFIEIESRTTLKIIKTTVIILGVKRVKPSDIFIEYAQMISNTPAKIKIAQAITFTNFYNVRSSRHDDPLWGRSFLLYVRTQFTLK